MEGFARLAVALNQPGRAARLFGFAEALRDKIQSFLPPADLPEYNDSVDTASTLIGEATFAVGWAEGRAMSIK